MPEKILKFGVGAMLSAFAVYWTGEGLGIPWPRHDFAIVVFGLIFYGCAFTRSYFAAVT